MHLIVYAFFPLVIIRRNCFIYTNNAQNKSYICHAASISLIFSMLFMPFGS